jgi:hypothetical protein
VRGKTQKWCHTPKVRTKIMPIIVMEKLFLSLNEKAQSAFKRKLFSPFLLIFGETFFFDERII